RTEALPQIARTVVRHVVLQRAAFDACSHLGRQRLEREIHVRKARVAAALRNFERIEQAERKRLLAIRVVRVPYDFSIAQYADRLAVFNDIRNDHDLGMRSRPLLAGFRERREIEGAETRAESDQLG